VNCKIHPKYDHTAGDPTGETPLQAKATNRGRENCKDCWQARAKWLDGQLTISEDDHSEYIKTELHGVEKQGGKMKFDDTDNEFTYGGKWWFWILLMVVLSAPVYLGLRWFGVFGERVIFENSFQYSEARKVEIATYEAQLAEIEGKLANTNLDANTRTNLEAQRSALRVRLNVARSRQ